mmetsp:Transcript_63416/g.74247  ORF Transcript_63416/g.74247 Transcript_63416/m.74247 type:complete len:149 (-) Transcript_63416:401-847(-)
MRTARLHYQTQIGIHKRQTEAETKFGSCFQRCFTKPLEEKSTKKAYKPLNLATAHISTTAPTPTNKENEEATKKKRLDEFLKSLELELTHAKQKRKQKLERLSNRPFTKPPENEPTEQVEKPLNLAIVPASTHKGHNKAATKEPWMTS